MEGRQRRSFTEEYKRQAAELVAFEWAVDHVSWQGTGSARFGAAALG